MNEDNRTKHYLEALDLLREFTDDIPGSDLTLPDGGSIWLHTEHNVRQWLADMYDRIQQARVHEREPAEVVTLNPDFFAGGKP